MGKFDTKNVALIKSREIVEQLLINGVGQLDAFEKSLRGTTYIKQFPTIINYIQHFANGESIGGRVKFLQGVKDGVTEYEFITHDLRVYAIQQPGKKIILFGGKKMKADSSDNIASFRHIKKAYLEYLNQQRDDKRRTNKR